MEEQDKTSRQYPAKNGRTICGDRVHGLLSTRDHECTATCASVQGVPSQGILDSRTKGTLDSRRTCGTSGPHEQGGPAHTRQLVAMPHPASRRERQRAASDAASNTPPQTSATTGGAEADNSMDVTQSSSSEAATSEEKTVDEDTLLRSPLEWRTETGTALYCSAEVSAGGTATGRKRKTEGGPTPPQAFHKNKRKHGHTLGATFKQAEEKDLLLNDNHRAFPVVAARVWNGLSPDVTSAPSLPSFKRRLKTELFARSYPDSSGRI